MKIYEFDKFFPDEESCKQAIKEYREKQGVVCKKCGCTHHNWINKGGGMFQCSECGYCQSLKANTIMHNSKLPYRTWLLAIHLLTATKQSFSALEMQKQLGLKYYQPAWELMHKLRDAMGKRDGKYTLMGNVEIDEGFFTTERLDEQKDEKLKAGAGSQAKAKVLVMAESTPTNPSEKYIKPKKVNHIKLEVIPNLKADTIAGVALEAISKESDIVSDATLSHSKLSGIFKSYDGRVVSPEDIGKTLPWVHIVIANAKSQITSTYHGVGREYLQEYLNEFAWKFNRRYYGEKLFERLIITVTSYKNEFMHRKYGKVV